MALRFVSMPNTMICKSLSTKKDYVNTEVIKYNKLVDEIYKSLGIELRK